MGGVSQLTSRIPVGTFIDHGVNRETTDAATSEVWDAYQKVLATGKFKHIVAKPGDTLPVRGMKVDGHQLRRRIDQPAAARRWARECELQRCRAVSARQNGERALAGDAYHFWQAEAA